MPVTGSSTTDASRPSPAAARAARTLSSSAPAGATLSRSGSSKRMKSWNTAVTRAREGVRVVGTEAAVRAAVTRPITRASGLRDRLAL